MVVLNGLCGFFQVHSWPFSSYPVYNALVSSTVEVLEFTWHDESGKEVSADVYADEANFMKEAVAPIEDEVISAIKTDWASGNETIVSDETWAKLAAYWEIWTANVSELEGKYPIKVLLIKRHLKPELRDSVLEKTVVGLIRP